MHTIKKTHNKESSIHNIVCVVMFQQLLAEWKFWSGRRDGEKNKPLVKQESPGPMTARLIKIKTVD